MITIISGRVTAEDIEDAELFEGIVPTSFLTNGLWTPPLIGLETRVMPICDKLPEIGEVQRNYTLVLHADALICQGPNEHLVRTAKKYNLPVYEVPA